jgi:hypothetical protein
MVIQQEDVPLQYELYREQLRHWPTEGRHILAQYDAKSIVVYQAFRTEIAHHTVAHRAFGGGGFSYSRMSWIKTNFLWMMYRAGWATKPNQEAILALRVSRAFFDGLLSQAVASTFDPTRFGSREEWQKAVTHSSVRLQWDPDHDAHGAPQQRRAVQFFCVWYLPLRLSWRLRGFVAPPRVVHSFPRRWGMPTLLVSHLASLNL